MAYDKKSFLAGIAVGRQMKGWGAGRVSIGGGDVATVILNESDHFQLSVNDVNILKESVRTKTPCRIALCYSNAKSFVVIPAALRIDDLSVLDNFSYSYHGIVYVPSGKQLMVHLNITFLPSIPDGQVNAAIFELGTGGTITVSKTSTFSGLPFAFRGYAPGYYLSTAYSSGTYSAIVKYLGDNAEVLINRTYTSTAISDYSITLTRQ